MPRLNNMYVREIFKQQKSYARIHHHLIFQDYQTSLNIDSDKSESWMRTQRKDLLLRICMNDDFKTD